MTIFTKDKNDPQIKPEEMTSGELLAFLKATPVAEWNAQYINARHRRPLYRANLRGANLCGVDLCGVDLHGANLYGVDLYGANLCGANLCGANLRGVDGSVQKLTGKYLLVGPVAGYHVSLFATEDGHAVQAGCWTGKLDGMIARAAQDGINGESMAEVEILRTYLQLVLASWQPKGECKQDSCTVEVPGNEFGIDVERTLASQDELITNHEERITSLEQSRAALAESLRGNQ